VSFRGERAADRDAPASASGELGSAGRVLHDLVSAGTRAIATLGCSGWTLRLADYIHRFRHEYGSTVRTTREPHSGGSHTRYFLDTEVEIVGSPKPAAGASHG
jgi:hypothetical protein